MQRITRRQFLGVSAGMSLLSLGNVGATPLANRLDKGKKDVFRELEQEAERYLSTYRLPGMSVGAIVDNKLVFAKGFGVKELGRPVPMTGESIMSMCSVSKAFAGTAIMQLVEAGKMDVDHPMVEYVPYFELIDPRYTQITIRHILSHTSGLPALTDADFWGEWQDPWYDDGAAERYVRSLKEANVVLSSDPGTAWGYSDMGYDVLADVIHKVSGELFETYCKNHIFDPLGMSHTTFLKSEVPPGLLVNAHVRENGQTIVSPIFPYDRKHAPSSCLFCNIKDMARWVQAHFNGGELHGHRILQPENQAKLWQPLFDFGNGWGYGWGWMTGEWAGHPFVGMFGGQPGIDTAIGLITDVKLSTSAFINFLTQGEPGHSADYAGWAQIKLLEAGL